MSKTFRILLIIAGIALVVIVAAAVVLPKARQTLEQPLGPALELPTHTPTLLASTATQAATAVVQASTATPGAQVTLELPTATQVVPTQEPTSTPAPLCGGPPVMMVLGIGADNGSENYTYGLGDVIRIARVDFVTPKVTMISLPRDLWVEIPGISDHYGITHGKLNQSYLYGGKGMGYYDGPGEGPGLMARTLDLNFGVQVDHYGAVNYSAFKKIIDAVGGIDVTLTHDVDGTSTDPLVIDLGYFTAGRHHFMGEEALRFARIRRMIGDLARQENQNLVLCALKEKVLSPSVLPKTPQIINALLDDVLTDLSLEQIGQLMCLLPQLKRENIILSSLPKDIFTQAQKYSPEMRANTFVLDADNQVLRDYISRFISGEWPDQPKEPSCP
jgi:LCP family protein required for cell wall assembly